MRYILPALLVLAGCSDLKQAFNRGFEQSFEKSFQDSCRQAAGKNGAPADVVNKYCDCAMKEFEKSRSMDQAAKACAPK
jgi:hypothetical protein